ncbi:transposase [Paraphaeosphaeria sporulosa]
MDSREASIQAAIADINSGVFKSQRAAALAYNLPQSTISTRINGRTPRPAAHQHQQRLSPKQEEFLADWIIDQDNKGYPPSHARAREMAIRVLQSNGDTEPLGKRYIQHFITRNPRVASVIGRKLDTQRADAATPEQIRAFIELFEVVRKELNIPIKDAYNMDETGTALGVGVNSRVLASSTKKKAYIKSPENREWASVIECVSATGRKLRCAVIFKGQSLQTTWFTPQSVPNWLYTTSENGWTSKAIGAEWLRRIFIPETAPDNDQQYQLLVLDGHSSHVDIEFLWICKINRIQLLFLPPHSTHVLQPLDLSGFSIIKSNYRNQLRDLSSYNDAAPIKKEQLIQYYHLAREEGLTERVISTGWRVSADSLSPLWGGVTAMITQSHGKVFKGIS